MPRTADNGLPELWVLVGQPRLGRGGAFEFTTGATTSSLLNLPRRKTNKRYTEFIPIAVLFVLGLVAFWVRRKYRNTVFISTPSTPTVQRAKRRLNSSTFLVAHNAFASRAYDWSLIDAAQALSYEEMFEQHGVRGFMLDVWPSPAQTPAHSPQGVPPALKLRHGSMHDELRNPDMPFAPAISEFVRILKKHTTEVLFVFIESPPGWLPDALSNQAFAAAIPQADRDMVALD